MEYPLLVQNLECSVRRERRSIAVMSEKRPISSQAEVTFWVQLLRDTQQSELIVVWSANITVRIWSVLN